MVKTRITFTKQNWVCKLAAAPRLSAALENIYGKNLVIQKQLTKVICQVNLLADKSTNLPDTYISKHDLNKMQGTMDEHLAK